jgi:hypothetical protein
VLAVGSWSLAADQAVETSSEPKSARKAALANLSDREQIALDFAQRHHPELAALLPQLRQRDRHAYESAVKELVRTSERLEKLQTRQPEKYEAELAIWKLDSRIHLLVARAVSAGDDSSHDEILSLVQQRNELRIRQLEQERERLSARTTRLKESISQLRSGGSALAESETERLLKSAESRTKGKKPDQAAPKRGVLPEAASTNSSQKSNTDE